MRVLPHQIVRSLLFEYLKENPTGQIATAVDAIAKQAVARGLAKAAPGFQNAFGVSGSTLLGSGEYNELYLVVQQLLWQLLARGVIVWGLNQGNESYPWYRTTEYGRNVLSSTSDPQPYDPDGFLAEFDRRVKEADPVVRGYLAEAVHSFNHGCPRAAAVLLGCASEKAMLLLPAQFEAAISDPGKRQRFRKDSQGTSIHQKYAALRDRLQRMADSRKLAHDHRETIGSELPSGFEIIRRCRNDAGHPALGAAADQDTVFLNLRSFTEYARRVFELCDYFKSATADW